MAVPVTTRWYLRGGGHQFANADQTMGTTGCLQNVDASG
jgi:hypothetical protein